MERKKGKEMCIDTANVEKTLENRNQKEGQTEKGETFVKRANERQKNH